MTTERIKAIQREIGVEPDGFWGPISRTAARTFLRKMCPNNPWPESNTTALRNFYGDFGKDDDDPVRKKWIKDNIVAIDVKGLGLKYNGKTTSAVRCHRLVADSLKRILLRISMSKHADVLEWYRGCFQIRQMRNGDKWSTHSWAIAIDIGTKGNGLKTPWPITATMPWEVIKIFADEGWLSGAVIWGYDAMHFQATKF